ncbi:NUDIX domain-containing protein [Lacihabitans sp. LS3-19]|uniref:NUDIX domain-containing protein n=1 Tax=Lacihabitans sp. LS3-19 TaxID=2487335 RepID=UPI0020CE95CA|nr:NUDIX domain-containing protein [Lacihabitans sp. LS3-19]MCP9766728.1 NUDIX domain-containing protein [Lacihabitans sp. LS3-19]
MNIRPCAIIVADNKMLTLKYNYNNTEIFAIPGGNLEFGERLEEALVRELEEELSLKITVDELLFVCEVHKNDKDTLHCIFTSDILSGTPKLNAKETSALEFKWQPIETLNIVNLYPNIGIEIQNKLLKNIESEVFLGEISQPWY